MAQKTIPAARNVMVVYPWMSRILSPAMASSGRAQTARSCWSADPPVGDGHDRDCGVDAEAIGRIEHDWPLHGELSTAGGDEEVHKPSGEQRHDTEGLRGGDVHEEIGEHSDRAGAHHHAEDSGTEGKLQQDVAHVLGAVSCEADELERVAHVEEDEREE